MSCPGMKGVPNPADKGQTCINPVSLQSSGGVCPPDARGVATLAIMSDFNDSIAYCVERPTKTSNVIGQTECPTGWTLKPLNGETQVACYPPTVCNSTAPYCHASKNTADNTPCGPSETAFFYANTAKPHNKVYVCSSFF